MAEHKCIPWVYVVELFWVSASTCTLPAAAACSELFETTFVFIVARYLKLPPHKILKAEDETVSTTSSGFQDSAVTDYERPQSASVLSSIVLICHRRVHHRRQFTYHIKIKNNVTQNMPISVHRIPVHREKEGAKTCPCYFVYGSGILTTSLQAIQGH
ncbi:hypothetical protein MRX96_004648 [Rhipicephalus microplus]